jgi:hypothetical protein
MLTPLSLSYSMAPSPKNVVSLKYLIIRRQTVNAEWKYGYQLQLIKRVKIPKKLQKKPDISNFYRDCF